MPRGIVARTADEAAAAFRQVGRARGGRQSPDSCRRPRQRNRQDQSAAARRATGAQRPTKRPQVAGRLLGQPLVTIQTGPEGQTVRQVLVEEGCDIARELYLGIVVDRAAAGPVLMVSSEGGMDIEHVAAHTPERIFKRAVSIPTPVCRAFRSASWRRSWI